MQQVTLTFSEQELHELTRQLYFAGFFSQDINYPNRAIGKAVEEKICTIGFNEVNDKGHYEPGEDDDGAYRLSLAQARKLDPIVLSYKNFVIADYLCEELANRDFEEKHGPLENIDFDEQPALLQHRIALLLKYGYELTTNGVRNLRLVRPQDN